MENINFEKEWNFIIAETHNRELDREGLVKREILFALQILLSKSEFKNYFALKLIYCKN